MKKLHSFLENIRRLAFSWPSFFRGGIIDQGKLSDGNGTPRWEMGKSFASPSLPPAQNPGYPSPWGSRTGLGGRAGPPGGLKQQPDGGQLVGASLIWSTTLPMGVGPANPQGWMGMGVAWGGGRGFRHQQCSHGTPKPRAPKPCRGNGGLPSQKGGVWRPTGQARWKRRQRQRGGRPLLRGRPVSGEGPALTSGRGSCGGGDRSENFPQKTMGMEIWIGVGFCFLRGGPKNSQTLGPSQSKFLGGCNVQWK